MTWSTGHGAHVRPLTGRTHGSSCPRLSRYSGSGDTRGAARSTGGAAPGGQPQALGLAPQISRKADNQTSISRRRGKVSQLPLESRVGAVRPVFQGFLGPLGTLSHSRRWPGPLASVPLAGCSGGSDRRFVRFGLLVCRGRRELCGGLHADRACVCLSPRVTTSPSSRPRQQDRGQTAPPRKHACQSVVPTPAPNHRRPECRSLLFEDEN